MAIVRRPWTLHRPMNSILNLNVERKNPSNAHTEDSRLEYQSRSKAVVPC